MLCSRWTLFIMNKCLHVLNIKIVFWLYLFTSLFQINFFEILVFDNSTRKWNKTIFWPSWFENFVKILCTLRIDCKISFIGTKLCRRRIRRIKWLTESILRPVAEICRSRDLYLGIAVNSQCVNWKFRCIITVKHVSNREHLLHNIC